tara:strand:+ start:3656 stop:4501 length:846 start_codon:yes stop_codon:yes gene_type:complete
MIAECLITAKANLGEGPVWDQSTNEIVWVDIMKGNINRVTIDGNIGSSKTLPLPVGAIAPNLNDWIAATPAGLYRVNDDSYAFTYQLKPGLRMNDGKADAAGRFVVGTMHSENPSKGFGDLWSIDEEGMHLLISCTNISNGLDWSADNETMFFIDTPTQSVDAFDYELETGNISNRRKWAHIDPELGSPDGMCIDVEGGIWVALWGGGAVIRLVDGKIDERIELPTPQVTCPVFAGVNLDQLIITTAATGLEPYSNGAGDLYICTPGIQGFAPNFVGNWSL